MKIKNNIIVAILSLVVAGGMSSCTSYLDKDPDSNVSQEEAFKNFFNFQGYIEEMYNCVPDKFKGNGEASWNFGDDEILASHENSNSELITHIDAGNFWNWQTNGRSWLYSEKAQTSGATCEFHGLWNHSWYCIRKANLGIENIGLMVDATDEERDIILGQLYFHRAWWHFELMQFLGGLPYIEEALSTSNVPDLSRLSLKETALKAAADFAKAAELLPIDWDNTQAGAQSKGYNDFYANKISALAYAGKAYLWAASPICEVGIELGGANTYTYNKEYAAEAANAFGELLKYVDEGQTKFALAEYKYSDIYNHKPAADAVSCFSDIFYTVNQNYKLPGSTEAIFRGPANNINNKANWQFSKNFTPKLDGFTGSGKALHLPTANYIRNYGMANGLPLDDPDSGFDKEYPFKNRDPRFYHDIIFDGVKYVNGTIADPTEEKWRYASLYTGGLMRDPLDASRTGYFIGKFTPIGMNKYDQMYANNKKYTCYLPYVRLADIYLMYAEATAAMGGRDTASDEYPTLTSVNAVDAVRQRPGLDLPGVNAKFTGNDYMDEVRRERAVELAYEGYRYHDLQRWLLLAEPEYVVKTALEFNRVESDSFFTSNDPRNAKVTGYDDESNVLLTRKFTTKHYLFPFYVNDVSISANFPQNPGW